MRYPPVALAGAGSDCVCDCERAATAYPRLDAPAIGVLLIGSRKEGIDPFDLRNAGGWNSLAMSPLCGECQDRQ